MSKSELQRWFLEFVISFSIVYTVFGSWDLGSANSFWDHVIQVSIMYVCISQL